ncbi:hypothetical protein [Actinomyces ruminis]|uniref:hypothetical protein n=1 Tax=Actinomyces ruminis TaxID=1937003 RepID=UPI00211F2AC5|nr:hypothetical protein [Actinomyces ruminis]
MVLPTAPEVPVSDLIVRWGGLRAVAALTVKTLLIVVLAVFVPLYALDPFGATHTPAVQIHDEADVLDDDASRPPWRTSASATISAWPSSPLMTSTPTPAPTPSSTTPSSTTP